MTSLPEDILSSILVHQGITYEELKEIATFNDIWTINVLSQVLTITDRIGDNNRYCIINDLKKIIVNQNCSLILTFITVLGEQFDFSTIYYFFMDHQHYIQVFKECYDSHIINPNQNTDVLILVYSFFQKNQDILSQVNIQSLFLLPHEVCSFFPSYS